jgi:hypothetical protein
MDGMFVEIFKPILRQIHATHIEEVRHNTQKEVRIIDTLEPVLNQHRLIVHPDVIQNDLKQANKDPHFSLFWQMTRITRERGALKHDDALDAFAMGVRYWVEHMAQDNQEQQRKREDRLLDEELKVFFKHLVQNPTDPNDILPEAMRRNY